jgi:hypothetical protein
VDGRDDLFRVDALEVDRGRAQVRVTELRWMMFSGTPSRASSRARSPRPAPRSAFPERTEGYEARCGRLASTAREWRTGILLIGAIGGSDDQQMTRERRGDCDVDVEIEAVIGTDTPPV